MKVEKGREEKCKAVKNFRIIINLFEYACVKYSD